jgi:hypothetical protein
VGSVTDMPARRRTLEIEGIAHGEHEDAAGLFEDAGPAATQASAPDLGAEDHGVVRRRDAASARRPTTSRSSRRSGTASACAPSATAPSTRATDALGITDDRLVARGDADLVRRLARR